MSVVSLVSDWLCLQRISTVTEEIALHTNDTVGGLLNASMGNVTELIVSIVALKKGALRIVQVGHPATRVVSR